MRLLLLLLFVPFGSYSQTSSIIADTETHTAIPYASIYIKNTEKGTSSNLNGSFTLKLTPYDTLIISSIGYKKLEIPYDSAEDTIYLDQDIRQMTELVVSPERSFKLFPSKNVIGEVKSSFFADNYWLGAGGKPYKIARFFDYDKKYDETRFLESITLETLSDLKEAKFSINFYTIGSDGMPKDPLLNQYIIYDTKKNRSKVTIPLIDHHLYFPREGLFLVIQFLSIDQNRSLRDVPLEYAGTQYKYKYDPSFSLVKTQSPSLFTFNNKAQKWVLSNRSRVIEAELVLTE